MHLQRQIIELPTDAGPAPELHGGNREKGGKSRKKIQLLPGPDED